MFNYVAQCERLENDVTATMMDAMVATRRARVYARVRMALRHPKNKRRASSTASSGQDATQGAVTHHPGKNTGACIIVTTVSTSKAHMTNNGSIQCLE